MQKPFLIFLFLLLLSLQELCAQSLPVLSRTELQVPNSLLLSDYSRPGVTRLALNLLLQDNSIANYAVRLRLVIEGNNITIRTRPDFRPPPIFLNGGINERFLGSDLEAYFRSENLIFQGLSRTAFERNGGRLPEGFYRIYFEVLDFNRDIVLSTPSQGTASAWLLLNDPPLLNLPAQEKEAACKNIKKLYFCVEAFCHRPKPLYLVSLR